jgi:hypothetical protein
MAIPFPEMIPVPVCEFCAVGRVADDDLAVVAVAILRSETQGLEEFVCNDHLLMLAPELHKLAHRYMLDISPQRFGIAWTPMNAHLREVEHGMSAELLPIGPVTIPVPEDEGNGGWTSGIGVLTYDDGTPRPYCSLCGHFDGWHFGSCPNMPD